MSVSSSEMQRVIPFDVSLKHGKLGKTEFEDTHK